MTVAVVSGTTSGLGRRYVDAIIASCPDIDEIWMVARRMDRMQQIAEKHPEMKFKCLSLDLSEMDSFTTLNETLAAEKPQIGLLISNAGVAFEANVIDMTMAQTAAMINLNVRGGTLFTQLCLPYVIDGGAIIQVASASSFVPNPRMAVYSSTKAYIASFGTGLREELRDHRINVLVAYPGRMKTEMDQKLAEKKRVNTINQVPVVNVEQFAYKTLALARAGRAGYTYGLFYKFYRVVAKIVPHSFLVRWTAV